MGDSVRRGFVNNLFISSETEPTGVTSPQIWIKLSSGQAYIYLDDTWQPIFGGDSYSYPLTIFLNNTNITFYVYRKSLQINNIINDSLDIAKLKVYDGNGDLNIKPSDEISIYHKLTLDSQPEKIFCGVVVTCPKTEVYPDSKIFDYDLNCADYGIILKDKLVKKVYQSEYVYDIIKDIIDDKLSGVLTYNNVSTVPFINYMLFNYDSVAYCIEQLAKESNYNWYVDADKDIHFFPDSAFQAPYTLSETPSESGHFSEFEIQEDRSQLRNYIYVLGGTYLDEYTQEIVADGKQLAFQLDYKPRSPIYVWVDTGAGYVEKTIGIDSVHLSEYDFVVNYNAAVVRNLDFSLLVAGNLIKVTYQREIQIIAKTYNQESINKYGVKEYVIKDSSISTILAAHAKAWSVLYRYSEPIYSGSFFTDQNGYKAGQLLTLNLPSWGYANSTHTIQSVRMRVDLSGKLEYNVDFSNERLNFTEFLKKLLDSTQEKIYNENETIHVSINNDVETITITDSSASIISHSGVYKWCDDAETETDKGRYNEVQLS